MVVFSRTPAVAAAFLVLLSGFSAWAHAFGQRYDLPLPLWLYALGAGAAVALSFAVMAFFIKVKDSGLETARYDILQWPGARWLGHPVFLNGLRLLSVAVIFLILATCFFGNPEPFKNFAPTFVWVIWWVGFAFISALLGNFWDLVNPWNIIFSWVEWMIPALMSKRKYPRHLGHWPAIVLFLAFAWMELISDAGEQPRNLGALIIAYSTITWAGMAAYGRKTWLQYGEVFSVVFGILSRFAPSTGTGKQWHLRFPGVALISHEAETPSAICFVFLLLSSVTFDGILETPSWKSFLEVVAESHFLRGGLVFLQQSGIDLLKLIETLALFALPAVFLAVFFAVCWLVGRIGGAKISLRTITGFFALSIIPIAIAYHLSHYLSYLLIAGQNIIPLASDPFGWGWDLFATTTYRLDIGIINAKLLWYVAVTAIIIGHIMAIYIAHRTALVIFSTSRKALISQLPMLFLMVGYTMISLWVLSQPIIK